MRSILKRVLSLGLSIAMLFGVTSVVCDASVEYVVSNASADYYANITATDGNSLLGQVHDLIVSTHDHYTSYNDCKTTSYVIQTDKGNGNNTIMDFYTQEDISAPWAGGTSAGTWNREHVWCQSLSNGMWGKNGAGSDMHHIRPSEVRLNSARGNDTFGETNGGTPVYYKDSNETNKYVGGYVSGSTFEPLDKVKGDVARIVMYVYTHYNTYKNVYGSTNGSGSNQYFGTLKFTNVMSLNNEKSAIDLLLKWHKADPVDRVETARNDAVYEIQGNRNPFVDHPEYADAIWGSGSVSSKPESISLNVSSLTLDAGESYILTATSHPAGAKADIVWTSSDASVATVSQSGEVTAVGGGVATVTATVRDNSAVKASATVTVNAGASEGKPDEGKISEFHNAVSQIDDSTLSGMYGSIQKAMTAYESLSEADRAAAREDIEAFEAAIAKYNEKVNCYNAAAEKSENVALKAMNSFIEWIGAFMKGLKTL